MIRASLKETDLARVQAGLVAEVVAEPRLYRAAGRVGYTDQGPYVVGHLLIPFQEVAPAQSIFAALVELGSEDIDDDPHTTMRTTFGFLDGIEVTALTLRAAEGWDAPGDP